LIVADCKVFYSWQSDLPNPTNRSFIETALTRAVRSIQNDTSIEVEPVLDRDTADIPGSPDIANTIFSKIEQAYVFVCDISIINPESQSRPTPNPNVLIELGYAIKSLGPERIILIMNTAFGDVDQLPFDLRTRRVTTYRSFEADQDKASERRRLEGVLLNALTSIFTAQENRHSDSVDQSPSIGEQARAAIESNQPNQSALVRNFMRNLISQLDAVAPNFRERVSDQDIWDSLEETIEITVEFSRCMEVIASMKSSDSAMIAYKSFDDIIDRYYFPTGYAGAFHRLAFDFYKFIGHEWLVILVSFLIRQECWDLIAQILDEELYTQRLYSTDKPGSVPFTYVSRDLEFFRIRKERLGSNRISLHADLLNERHTQGELGNIVPMSQFISAAGQSHLNHVSIST
jgi:hypothetical protein